MAETVLFTVGLMIVGPLRAVVISEHRYATRILKRGKKEKKNPEGSDVSPRSRGISARVSVVVVQRPW